MKKIIIFGITLLLFIGGCSGMDKEKEAEKVKPEKLPNTNAFQDEFTRNFMASTEEMENGYYLFESGIEAFTLNFPKNANMDKVYYQSDGGKYEKFNFGETSVEKNIDYVVVGTLRDEESTKWVDSYLNSLSKTNGYEGEFRKYTQKNNDIYYAEFIDKVSEEKNGFYYVFLAYIMSSNSNKALSMSYSSKCYSSTQDCLLNLDIEREKAKKVFHSVRFKP